MGSQPDAVERIPPKALRPEDMGYAVTDPDFRLQRRSDAFAAIVGDFPAGTALESILPVFSGLEETLSAVATEELPFWRLRPVTHSQPGQDTPGFIELTILPHLHSGGVFVVVRDVSQEVEIERNAVQRRNELRLLQRTLPTNSRALDEASERIEADDQERSLFLSLISIELQGPLAIIHGYADWLLNEDGGPLTAAQRDVLSLILASSRRAEALVDDLLGTDRVQTGFSSMMMVETDVNDLLEHAVSVCRRLAAAQQVTISFEPDELPTVAGVATLLQEAFINLISNAIHYNRPDGRVTITARPDHGGVLVQVHDTGAGIPADEQERIFLPFQRGPHLNASTNRRLGLGLFHVRMIAEAHGGRVWLESQIDAGSTFFFWIPANGDAPDHTQTPAIDPARPT